MAVGLNRSERPDPQFYPVSDGRRSRPGALEWPIPGPVARMIDLLAPQYGIDIARCGSAVLLSIALGIVTLTLPIALLAPGGAQP